jgi:MFS transporter, ACS family, D-galactonate transporter
MQDHSEALERDRSPQPGNKALAEPGKLSTFTPVLLLLALCLLINYIDRSNLSLAAPLLKQELHISATQLGVLFSAFFWTYTALQFVSGWLVDRFGANRVIAAGFLLWSLATAVTGFVKGFAMLFLVRLVLGIGESVAIPSYSRILARYLPEHNRGFANGVLIAAQKFGPAVGTLGAGFLIARYGWRPVFIGIGVISLGWLPAWMRWMPHGEGLAHPITATPKVVDILRQRSFWGACAGQFTEANLLYFTLLWIPLYLVHEHHLSIRMMTMTASAFYLLDAISAVASGWLADFWIRQGTTPTLVRKSVMVIGHATAAIAMTGCSLAGPHTYFEWLMAAGVGSGVAGSGVFAFSQTLAGPQAAGSWTGLQNGFANLAGIVGPWVTGLVVDKTGHFQGAFAITAALLLVGGFSWVFGVGRLEQVNWPSDCPSLSSHAGRNLV